MNARQISEAISAMDAAIAYILNVPYTTNADYVARREVLMNLGGSKGALLYSLESLKVSVEND